MVNVIAVIAVISTSCLIQSVQTAQLCVPKDYGNGGTVCVCNATYCDTIDPVVPVPTGQYLMYTSSMQGLRFSITTGEFKKQRENKLNPVFNIDRKARCQTMIGFGGAFTDAAGINILSLSKPAQENLLRSYYSKNGIEYNLGRVPIGGTDFSTHPYTYDDGMLDPQLKNFNLTQEDFNYKISIINRAKAMSEKEISLIATAWSAPPWMKSNKAITGFGFLRNKFYNTWANYHLKFLDEYERYNITIWALTTGNEPINGIIPVIRFNSMGWSPYSHRIWIGKHLGPKLRNSRHNKTLILALDDQRFLLPWWMSIVLEDRDAANQIDGIGIHWYWDFIMPPSVLEETHNAAPNKFLLYTEASIGDKPWDIDVILGSWMRGELYMTSILETINNWVTGWMDWNIALNTQGGPDWVKNFVDCPITVNATADEFYKQPMYYAIGHFSKFVQRDSVRLKIDPWTLQGVSVMAIQNPDNGIVIVLHNTNYRSISITVYDPKRGYLEVTLPSKSFTTLLYW